jgi:hypothetical protein
VNFCCHDSSVVWLAGWLVGCPYTLSHFQLLLQNCQSEFVHITWGHASGQALPSLFTRWHCDLLSGKYGPKFTFFSPTFKNLLLQNCQAEFIHIWYLEFLVDRYSSLFKLGHCDLVSLRYRSKVT